MSSFLSKSQTRLAIVLICSWLSACGGGGGSGGGTPQSLPASLSVGSSTLSVTLTTADAAPTSQIKASISNPGSAPYYFSEAFTANGLASIDATSDAKTGTFTLQFKSPSTLAPGTYSDTVTIEACADSGCTQQIQGSPTTVNVQYVVNEASGTAPTLSSLGPNTVTAGGTDTRLVVIGSHLDASSVILWDGVQLPTALLSSNMLVAPLSAAIIAGAKTVTVTVANLENTGTTVSNGLTFTVSTASVTPTLLLSTKILSASFDTSLGGGPILSNPLAIAVNGATNTNYYFSISFTGSAVNGIVLTGQTGGTSGITIPSGPTANRITGEPGPGLGQNLTGSIFGPIDFVTQVMFVPAASLGAGTYTDTITVNVCTDPQCTKPVAGSPQAIAVTYSVTGNAMPNVQFSLMNASLVLETPTSGTAQTGTTLITTNGLPPYGAYVFPSVGAGTALAGATVQSDLNGTATLTVTTKPPASLGSGIYSDSVSLQICYDSACTKPAITTPLIVQVTYVVDAAAGVEFTQATIPVAVSDLAWNATRGQIYATADSDTGGISQSLLVVNPTTATIEQVASLGQGTYPTSIALSDDGQYAYIIDSVLNQVLQVDLGTLTVTQRVSIPTIASQLKAVPGQPTSFAVQGYSTSNTATLLIYDGTTPRPQTFSTGSIGTNLLYTFGADASTAYAYDVTQTSSTMYQLSVSNTGFSVAQQTANVGIVLANNNEFEYAGGLVYSLSGSVYEPSTQSTKSPFKMLLTGPHGGNSTSYAFAIDASLNRAYFMTDDSPTPGEMTLEGFNLSTQTPTWLARFPSSNPLGGKLIRWGTNGIAFVGGNYAASPNITLISGSIISR